MAFKLANGSGKVIKKVFLITLMIGVILFLQMKFPEEISYLIMAILAFSVVVFFFSFWFFRDPERWPDLEEENDRAIIAPADGKVIKVDKYLDEEYRMEESQIVSIFMSVFNVHVNRYPVKGKVEYVNYKKGKFMAAWNDKASEYNEQAVIGKTQNAVFKIALKDGFQQCFSAIAIGDNTRIIHIRVCGTKYFVTFKVILAIEKGFLPNTVLPDIPRQLGGSEIYQPMNHFFKLLITYQNFSQLSQNLLYVICILTIFQLNMQRNKICQLLRFNITTHI